ncbi:organic solvent tolerance protein [Candidatus Brocadia sinica JPN1]|uniref:Organic solvent tolerance protein n=1 Tax=Candidatus Brocadia sinica JPN1 TaxID=1197129 RepID=A0ABQ0JZP3_9BACT|nr:organic solvent tolerance protein [Candidatus Brocadia sinica JPN1]
MGLKTWIAFLLVIGKYGIFCNRSREIFGRCTSNLLQMGWIYFPYLVFSDIPGKIIMAFLENG